LNIICFKWVKCGHISSSWFCFVAKILKLFYYNYVIYDIVSGDGKLTVSVTSINNDNPDIMLYFKNDNDTCIAVPHMHSRYEIYYNICGAKAFMCDGKIYPCSGRELIVVPKICAHKAFADKEISYERCIISVDEAVIDMISMLCESDDSLSWLTDGNHTNISVTRLTNEEHNKFMLLANEYLYSEKSGDKLQNLADFISILSFLGTCFNKLYALPKFDDSCMTPVEKAIMLIEQKFKTITVLDVCREIYFSEDHLNRLFKAEISMTIKQYIVMRKLTEAKKHLYQGKTAKEACFLSGFRDYSNFRRTFKNYEGYNPGNLEELTSPI